MSGVDNTAAQTDRDGYMDLKALSKYSSLSVRTLRQYLKDPVHPLPSFRPGGKILIRLSHFDQWMARFHRDGSDLDGLVSDVLEELELTRSTHRGRPGPPRPARLGR